VSKEVREKPIGRKSKSNPQDETEREGKRFRERIIRIEQQQKEN
jgi:hypothetical protein